ncbi:MAG: hypothetical protein AAF682_08090 [Planctomycetota bacterium]
MDPTLSRPPGRSSASRRTVLAAVGFLGALAWGAFWMTSFRTYEYGGFPALRDVGTSPGATAALVLAVAVLPVAAVLGFRRRPQRWLRSVALICALSWATAEAWAGAEEALWRRRAPRLEAQAAWSALHAQQLGAPFDAGLETVHTTRWWPFEHHCLWYHPGSERFGGHD